MSDAEGPTPTDDENDEDDEEFTPTKPQERIITGEDEDYPMRVLAGAGTGKTATMIRKIEYLIRQQNVPPEEILALTFTNKAAEEINERLVDQIGAEGHDVEAYTYHSVADHLLRDYIYQSDVDPDYEIATEPDQLALMYEVADEMEYWFLKPRIAEPGQHGGGAIDKLQSFIHQMKQNDIEPDTIRHYLDTQESPATLISLEGLPDELEAKAEELLDFGRLRKANPDRIEEYCIDGLNQFQSFLQTKRHELGTTPVEQDVRDYLQEMEMVCEELVSFFEDHKQTLEDKRWKVPAYLFNAKYNSGAPDWLPEIGDSMVDRLADVMDKYQTAADLAEGYYAYEHRLDEESLLDFDDLVIEARKLLKDETIQNDIATQYEYVFCDEFQDTDSIQFDLVAQLVPDDRLFVVGDDDQAIYEWRGANPANITSEFRDRFPNFEDRELSDNFRSRQPILTLANNALKEVPGRESEKELEPGEEEQKQDRGIITIDAPTTDAGNGRKVTDSEAQAEDIVAAINRLTNDEAAALDTEESFDPGDIAVLVRANRHADPIVSELRSKGIPYELSGGIAAESTGVRTVIAYLKLLTNPNRDDSLMRLLRMRYRPPESDIERLNTMTRTLKASMENLPESSFEAYDRIETASEALGSHDSFPARDLERKLAYIEETYNVPKQDQETLRRVTESLYWTLFEADIDSFEDPETLRTVREHLSELRDAREVNSLSRLYDRLKEITRIEWFLSEDERDSLRHLDNLVRSFGRESIQPELNEQFVEFLQLNAQSLLQESGGVSDQPETASDAVNLLSIHKSKGLEFPVVITPNLSKNDWKPRQQSFGALRHTLGDGIDSSTTPFDQWFRQREEAEQRRTFHVAVTRAEQYCILSGWSSDSEEDNDLDRSDITNMLPSTQHWQPTKPSFPVWDTVTSAAPPSAYNGTKELTQPLGALNEPQAIHDGQELMYGEAQRRVLEMAQEALNSNLTPQTLERLEASESLERPEQQPSLDIKHSPTSLDRFDTCARWHYMDIVASDFRDPDEYLDPVPVGGGGFDSAKTSANSRDVGILFHEVAERAGERDFISEEEQRAFWDRTADSVAKVHGYSDAVVEETKRCIERFFNTEASSWTVESTERSFEYTDSGYTFVGKIDAICVDENGNYVVVDYKTKRDPNPVRNSIQLAMYREAVQRLTTAEIADIAYVNVGDVSESALGVDRMTLADTDVSKHRTRILQRAYEAELESEGIPEPTPDTHCRACPHRNLLCSNQAQSDD